MKFFSNSIRILFFAVFIVMLFFSCNGDLTDELKDDIEESELEKIPTVTMTLLSSVVTNEREISIQLAGSTNVTGWYVSESSTPPSEGSDLWLDSDPETYTLSSGDGVKNVYAWVITDDGYFNIPESIAVTLDTVPPVISEFTLTSGTPTGSADIAFSLTCGNDVTAWFIKQDDDSTPALEAGGWVTVKPAGYTLTGGLGTKNVYIFIRDEAGNISSTDPINVDLQDIPVVTFSLTSPNPTNDDTITFELNSSSTGITGWYVAESDQPPAASAGDWESVKPTDYVLSAGDGEKTVYAWAINGAGECNAATSFTVTLDTDPPEITDFSNDGPDVTDDPVIDFSLLGDFEITAWLIKQNDSSKPLLESGDWVTGTPSSFTLTGETGIKIIYAFARDAAGNISPPESFSVEYVDTPTASLNSGTKIVGHESIEILFSDTMDTADIEAGIAGDFASESMTFSWDETNDPDDTLTMTPVTDTHWPLGTSVSLVINGDAANGVTMTEFSANLEINPRVHVYGDTGTDLASSGTESSPCASIQYAIGIAVTLYETGEVRVAEGTYTANGAVANVQEGISLYGGYSPSNWETQDTDNREVVLINDGTDSFYPTVMCYGSLTRQTVIDGFTIIPAASVDGTHLGVYCLGSPILRNLVIKPRADDGGIEKIGIYIKDQLAAPLVDNCDIDPGTCTSTVYSIYIDGATGDNGPVIQNSILRGGVSTSLFSWVVYIKNASTDNPPEFINNDFYHTESSVLASRMIYLATNGVAVVDNNDFFDLLTTPASEYTSLYEDSDSSGFISITNNRFHFEHGYIYRKSGGADILNSATGTDTNIYLYGEVTPNQLIGGTGGTAGNTKEY